MKDVTQNKQMRDSNFELMRIITMIMIVFWHFMCHGGLLNYSTGLFHNFLFFIMAVIYMHVNSFVLITGYFQSEQKFKLSKAIKINNSMWFYTAIFTLLFFIFGKDLFAISKVTLLHNILPISYDNYWFFTCYLILYLISPILNTVINNIDKKKFKNILLLLIIVIIILPYITDNGFYNNMGSTLSNFILLYLIGAYLKKYPINKNYFMKAFSINKQKLVLFISIFVLAGFNFLLWFFGNYLVGTNNGLAIDIGNTLTNGLWHYSNPILILQSVCYFGFFSLIKIKSTFINKVASYTMGVYLITEANYFRLFIYDFLGFNKISYSPSILIKVVLYTLSLFIICIIIEALRQFIFKKIYNTKLANKNRIWYRNYIKSLGIDVNW